MRFACLVYFDPRIAFTGSAENNAILDAAEVDRKRFVAQGIATEALTLPSEAVTVRVRNGKISATDGPFAETKEVLGGFVLVDAADIDEAVRMAATNPMAQLGCVEVRPLVDFSRPRPVM